MGTKRKPAAVTGEVIVSDANKGHRWQRGQSGNPSGRPLGSVSLSTTLLRRLTPERAAEIVDSVLDQAAAGREWAVQLVWDRIDGRTVQRTESVSVQAHVLTDALGQLSADEQLALLDRLERRLAALPPAPDTEDTA